MITKYSCYKRTTDISSVAIDWPIRLKYYCYCIIREMKIEKNFNRYRYTWALYKSDKRSLTRHLNQTRQPTFDVSTWFFLHLYGYLLCRSLYYFRSLYKTTRLAGPFKTRDFKHGLWTWINLIYLYWLNTTPMKYWFHQKPISENT